MFTPTRWRCRATALGLTAWISAWVHAGCPATVTLSGYQLVATYSLPSSTLSGASAVAWNWDSDTLLILPDSGAVLVMVSKTGVVLSQMAMKNFADTEGLTYMGGGTYALTEERLGRAYKFTYVAGGTLDRSTLQSIAIGPNTGTNDGSEGVSFDPRDGSWVSIKEKNPENVYRVNGSFATGVSTYTDLFPTASLGVNDIADVLVLATVPAVAAGPDANNLLLLSQSSERLLKVSRTGQILGTLSLTSLATNPEGVTMDGDQRLYICSDSTSPKLYVYAPPASDLCTCPSDLDGDGTVGPGDVAYALLEFGPCPGSAADLDRNGLCDFGDVSLLLLDAGPCP